MGINYNFWAMIGAWVSGIGVIFAACVSLYLARRSNRVKLRLECGPFSYMVGYIRGVYFTIKVSNIGLIPVTISDWGIKINSNKVISFLLGTELVKLPYTMSPEQSVSLHIQYHNFVQGLKEYRDILPRGRIKFYVCTAVGERHYTTSKKTYNELLTAFNE